MSPRSRLFSNNVASTTTEDITDTALTIYVADGSRIPEIEEDSTYYTMTLTDKNRVINEIVNVIARDGNTLTVERGQEGTEPTAWPAYTLILGLYTAGAATAMVQKTEVPVQINSLPCAFQSWRKGTVFGDDLYRRIPAAEGSTFASVDLVGGFADIAVVRQNADAVPGLSIGFEMQLAGGRPAEGSSNTVVNFRSFQCAQWRGIEELTLMFYAWRGTDYVGEVEVTILGSNEAEQPILLPDGSFTSGSYEIAKETFSLDTSYPNATDALFISGAVPDEMMQVAVRWSVPWAGSTAGSKCFAAFVGNVLFSGPPNPSYLQPGFDPSALALGAMYYDGTYPLGINAGANPLRPGSLSLTAVQTDDTPRYGGQFNGKTNMLSAPTFIVRSPETGQDNKAWNAKRKIDVDAATVGAATSGFTVQVSRPSISGAVLNVTSATWVDGIATIELEADHEMEVGDVFGLASVSPTAWNTPASGPYDAALDGTIGATVVFSMPKNPGSYVSGGTFTNYTNTVGAGDDLSIHAYSETIW
jgi:hypothetical protein